MKPFKHIFDSLDVAAGRDGKAVIPFFISENMVDNYYLKNPKREKQVVHANKLTGLILDNTQIIEKFLARSFQVNENWVPGFSPKPFGFKRVVAIMNLISTQSD